VTGFSYFLAIPQPPRVKIIINQALDLGFSYFLAVPQPPRVKNIINQALDWGFSYFLAKPQPPRVKKRTDQESNWCFSNILITQPPRVTTELIRIQLGDRQLVTQKTCLSYILFIPQPPRVKTELINWWPKAGIGDRFLAISSPYLNHICVRHTTVYVQNF
jgi:hypothetical protein